MMVVTNLYYSQEGTEHERLKYARLRDGSTGIERLIEPSELVDPQNISVGDEDAYKVTLTRDRLLQIPMFS